MDSQIKVNIKLLQYLNNQQLLIISTLYHGIYLFLSCFPFLSQVLYFPHSLPCNIHMRQPEVLRPVPVYDLSLHKPSNFKILIAPHLHSYRKVIRQIKEGYRVSHCVVPNTVIPNQTHRGRVKKLKHTFRKYNKNSFAKTQEMEAPFIKLGRTITNTFISRLVFPNSYLYHWFTYRYAGYIKNSYPGI